MIDSLVGDIYQGDEISQKKKKKKKKSSPFSKEVSLERNGANVWGNIQMGKIIFYTLEICNASLHLCDLTRFRLRTSRVISKIDLHL